MQKTRLGVSVGLISAIMYFLGSFELYVPVIILLGYILVFEQDEWLKKNAIQTAVIMIVFYIVTAVLKIVPNSSYVYDFTQDFQLGYLVNLIVRALNIIETLWFISLGLKALNYNKGSFTGRFCPNCGAVLSDNVQFCMNCGTKIDN